MSFDFLRKWHAQCNRTSLVYTIGLIYLIPNISCLGRMSIEVNMASSCLLVKLSDLVRFASCSSLVRKPARSSKFSSSACITSLHDRLRISLCMCRFLRLLYCPVCSSLVVSDCFSTVAKYFCCRINDNVLQVTMKVCRTFIYMTSESLSYCGTYDPPYRCYR